MYPTSSTLVIAAAGVPGTPAQLIKAVGLPATPAAVVRALADCCSHLEYIFSSPDAWS